MMTTTFRNWTRIALLALVLIALPALAQDAQEISPALQTQLDEIEALVIELRELEPLTEVNRAFPSREEAAAFVIADFEENAPDELLAAETQFYRAFDFVAGDFDLGAAYGELLATQAGGYYDPETQSVNTIPITIDDLGDELPLLEQITYAHEFTHALQDQHYGLRALQTAPGEGNIDGFIAVQSLYEGDATAVMADFLLLAVTEDPTAALSLLSDPDLLASAELPEGTPAILEAELTFPYIAGLEFVSALRDHGGWEAVDLAYQELLPVSTEQIIHPDRYLNGDAPAEVTVNADSDALDGEGWEVLIQRTLGEFYLREYLAQQLEGRTARDAAEGWGGDQFALFYNAETDQRAWVLRQVWDTAADADEFAAAYADYAAARIGTNNAAVTPALSCWSAAGEAICLAHSGDETIIAYAPSRAEAQALIDAQSEAGA
jgi:hypothetical protein